MCYPLENDILITVEAKTDKVKYEYLRAYYTLWNSITRKEKRVIVDCFAGSGHVFYRLPDGSRKKIYGSPLQAILRTIAISNNLTIILSEIQKAQFEYLEGVIKEIQEQGLPIFVRKTPKFVVNRTIDDVDKDVKTLRDKPKIIYPEVIGAKPPFGYSANRKKTKAEIVWRNCDANDLLDEIFAQYLPTGTRITKEGKEINWNTKAIFFIDPCGIVNWDPLIKRICERANLEEGIEIIMNWNYSGIARNVPNKNRRSVLSAIYGIPENEVDREFPVTFTIKDYLEKYLDNLRQYFRFVNNIGVARKRKTQPKMSDYREYFLIHCSNNESADSISLNKVKKLSRIVEYEDLFEKWGGPKKPPA